MADNFTPTQIGQATGNTNTLEGAVNDNKKANVWDSLLNTTEKVAQTITKDNIENQKIELALKKEQEKQKSIQDTNEGTFLAQTDIAKYSTMDTEAAHEEMLKTRNEILAGKSDMSESKQKGYLNASNSYFVDISKKAENKKANRNIANQVSASVANISNIADIPAEIKRLSLETGYPIEKYRDAFTTTFVEATALKFSQIDTKEGYDNAIKEYNEDFAKYNVKALYGTTALKGYYADMAKASKKKLKSIIQAAKTRYETNAKDFLAENSKTYEKPWDLKMEEAIKETGKSAEAQINYKKNYVKKNEEITTLNDFKKRDVINGLSGDDKLAIEKYPEKTKKINEELIQNKYNDLSTSGSESATTDIIEMINNNPGSEGYIGQSIKQDINSSKESAYIETHLNFLKELANTQNGAAAVNDIMSKKDRINYEQINWFAKNRFDGDYLKSREFVNTANNNEIQVPVVKDEDFKSDVLDLGNRGEDFAKTMDTIYKQGGQEAYDSAYDNTLKIYKEGITTKDIKIITDKGYIYDSTKTRKLTIDKSIAQRKFNNGRLPTEEEYNSINDKMIKKFIDETGEQPINIVDLDNGKVSIHSQNGGTTKVYSLDDYDTEIKPLTAEDVKNIGEKWGITKEIFANVNADIAGIFMNNSKKDYPKSNFKNLFWKKKIQELNKLPTTISDKTLNKLTPKEQYKVLGELDKNKYKIEKFVKYTNDKFREIKLNKSNETKTNKKEIKKTQQLSNDFITLK